MYRFADPLYLLLLLILPFMVWWYVRGLKGRGAKIRYSDVGLLKELQPTLRQKLRHGLFLMRLLAVTLLILALARPQSSSKEEEIST